MGVAVDVFDEPELAFEHGQRLHDPHDGLFLFGPYEADFASHPKGLHYAVIGTPTGVSMFRDFAARILGPVFPAEGEDSRLWPPFPGFEAAFHSTWPLAPVWSHDVDPAALQGALGKGDRSERAFAVVNLFMEAIERTSKRDARCDVIVCVVPDDVWLYCRPKSIVPHPTDPALPKAERDSRAAGQLSLLDEFDPRQYRLSPDFRRQIKARSMQHGIPIQIIRESALWLGPGAPPAGQRSVTPLCDRAWNLGTALYYKAGGRPWKLAGTREGVCYVGIAFRRAEAGDERGRTACCAAQMFLDSGDGIVFLGEYGPWYSPETREYHLDRDGARALLQGVLRTYQELEGQPLREVFLHARSEISDEEFDGYADACPAGVKLVGIRVRTEWGGTKLFRPGTRPVLRGTFRRVGKRAGYLWASGFKPRLGTYDGWETPVPLRIDVQHGEADLDQVARDIFALTKLNYNACRLGDSEPVTIKFSNAVGEILVSNRAAVKPQSRFRFYV